MSIHIPDSRDKRGRDTSIYLAGHSGACHAEMTSHRRCMHDPLGLRTSPEEERKDPGHSRMFRNQFRGRVLARSIDSANDVWNGMDPKYALALQPSPFLSHQSRKTMFQPRSCLQGPVWAKSPPCHQPARTSHHAARGGLLAGSQSLRHSATANTLPAPDSYPNMRCQHYPPPAQHVTQRSDRPHAPHIKLPAAVMELPSAGPLTPPNVAADSNVTDASSALASWSGNLAMDSKEPVSDAAFQGFRTPPGVSRPAPAADGVNQQQHAEITPQQQSCDRATAALPGQEPSAQSPVPKASTISSAASCTGAENDPSPTSRPQQAVGSACKPSPVVLKLPGNLSPPLAALANNAEQHRQIASMQDKTLHANTSLSAPHPDPGRPPRGTGPPSIGTPNAAEQAEGHSPAPAQPKPSLSVDVANLPAADSDSEISATSLQVSGPSKGLPPDPPAPKPAHSPAASSTPPCSAQAAPAAQERPADRLPGSPQHATATQDSLLTSHSSRHVFRGPGRGAGSASDRGDRVLMVSSSSSEITIRQQREVRMLWTTCERAAQEQRSRASSDDEAGGSHQVTGERGSIEHAEPASPQLQAIVPAASSTRDSSPSPRPHGILDHILSQTPHLLSEADRLQWQLKMTTSDLQTSQQQARGLGLALRREAGVRRGLEGALAAVHYEAATMERSLEAHKRMMAAVEAALCALHTEDAALREDQDGSTPKLKEQLGHLLHYIQGQCQKDSPSVHQEPDEAPLAGPRQLPAPSTTAHAAADANTIAAAAPQPHPMATADVGARHSMLEPEAEQALHAANQRVQQAEARVKALEDVLLGLGHSRHATYSTADPDPDTEASSPAPAAAAQGVSTPAPGQKSASQGVHMPSPKSPRRTSPQPLSRLASPRSASGSPSAVVELQLRLKACCMNEAALEAEVASLWQRLNEQGTALAAAQQAQHSAESNAAERESELLAQLDALTLKLQTAEAAAEARGRAHDREVQRLTREGAQQRSLLQARVAELQAVLEGAMREAAAAASRADVLASVSGSPVPVQLYGSPLASAGTPRQAERIGFDLSGG